MAVRAHAWQLAMASFAIAASMVPSAEPQQGTTDRPSFRTETTLIQVYAVVTDGKGRPVRGLAPEDFVLNQNGQRQTITQFAFVDGDRTEDAKNEFAQTDRPRMASKSGRAYLLILDDLRGSSSATGAATPSGVARAFIEHSFADADLAAVVRTSARAEWEQDFTGDRALLLKAITGPPSVGPPANPGTIASRVLETLEAAGDWLSRVSPERRTLVLFFGDSVPGLAGYVDPGTLFLTGVARGIGGTPRPAPPAVSGTNQTAQVDAARRAVLSLRRSGTPIYPISPTGRQALFGFTDNAESATGSTRGITRLQLAKSSSMASLAEQTGGLSLTNSDEYPRFFKRVVQDASTYYVLGYVAPDTMRPETAYPISLKVRRDKVTVRARESVMLPAPANLTLSPSRCPRNSKC